MVGQRLKPLVLEQLAARPDLRAFHILSHPLPSGTVSHTSRAVCSGHKSCPTQTEFETVFVNY
jgi:hypothetical protein